MKITNFNKKNITFSAMLAVVFLFSSCNKESTISPEPEQSSIQKKVSQISFEISANINGSVNTGSFTSESTDLGNLSGDFSETYKYKSGKYKSDVTFSDANGTITARVDGDIVFSDESNGAGTAIWRVIKCTGVYEKFYSDGTLTLVIADHTAAGTGTITESWTSN